MLEVKREYTPHINPNDCWNIVLAKVSGKKYEDIRREMYQKGYADDKGLHNSYTSEVLRQYGYLPVCLLVPRQKARIRHILEAFYEDEVVIASMNLEKKLPHLSYAYKGVDYTTSEVDSSMDDPVLYLWVKERR